VIAKIFTGGFVEPVFVHEDELVTDNGLQHCGLKRKFALSAMDKREENPMKKAKIGATAYIVSPLSADPALCIENIEQNLQRLMGYGMANNRVQEIAQTMHSLCQLLVEQLAPAETPFNEEAEQWEDPFDMVFEVSPAMNVYAPTVHLVLSNLDNQAADVAPVAAPAFPAIPFVMGPPFGAPAPALFGPPAGPAPAMMGLALPLGPPAVGGAPAGPAQPGETDIDVDQFLN
jgi:hypothetical protein